MNQAKIYDYQIVKELGEGGFGKVYQAVRKSDNKTIALKIIDITPSNQHLIELTQKEIDALKTLSNPSCNPFVICYYGSYYDPIHKQFFIEMELVEGKEMYDYVIDFLDNKPYPESTWYYYLLLIAKDLVNGIKYNTSKGIIHNDIKLENIMITNDTYLPKIIDYGLACNIQNSELLGKYCYTQGGTPNYIPPEYVVNGIRLPESDLWALGVLLYTAATGTMPFSGDTINKTFISIKNDEVKLNTTNQLLNNIVNGLLIKNPKERLTIEQLETLLSNIPNPNLDLDLNGNGTNKENNKRTKLSWLKSFDYVGKEYEEPTNKMEWLESFSHIDQAELKNLQLLNSLFFV